jgi:hypothetical protein
MVALLTIFFQGVVKLLLVVFGAIYAGMVLRTYRTVGPRYHLDINVGDPARIAERFLVWLGVRVLAGVTWVGGVVLDNLSEASAEVGYWLLRGRSAEFRSRFL